MGVFTFVCRESSDDWMTKNLNGELEASAGSTFEFQRKIDQVSLSTDLAFDVQSSFSLVTLSSGVFHMFIGGGRGGGAFIRGGKAATSVASSGGATAEASPAEEKKEESDDHMGFSLFD